jgi:hypothetical protein
MFAANHFPFTMLLSRFPTAPAAFFLVVIVASAAAVPPWELGASADSASNAIARPFISGWSSVAPERVIRISVTPYGDADVELQLRTFDNLEENRAAAMSDVASVMRSIFASGNRRLFGVTVLGSSSGASGSGNARTLLYASLAADRVAGWDWTRVTDEEILRIATIRWLPGGVCAVWGSCVDAA